MTALDRKLRALEHTCSSDCDPAREIHYESGICRDCTRWVSVGGRITVRWWERLLAMFDDEDLS